MQIAGCSGEVGTYDVCVPLFKDDVLTIVGVAVAVGSVDQAPCAGGFLADSSAKGVVAEAGGDGGLTKLDFCLDQTVFKVIVVEGGYRTVGQAGWFGLFCQVAVLIVAVAGLAGGDRCLAEEFSQYPCGIAGFFG